MYTRCPVCESWFLLRAAQLRAAGGQVRCGRCGHGFNALDNLADEPPPEPGFEDGSPPALTLSLAIPSGAAAEAATRAERAAEPKAGPEPPGPAATADGTRDAGSPPEPTEGTGEDEFVLLAPETDEEAPTLFPPEAESPPKPAGTEDEAAPAADAEPAPAAPGPEPPPLDAPADETPAAGRRWPWTVAAGALGLLLAGQLAYAWRGALAQNPALRPWVERICARLDCTVPTWREPAAFVVRERALVAHPEREGALLFTATLLNSAERAQPPPVLELRLSTLEGRLLGLRRFRPDEYVPGGAPGRVAPGGELAVRLELKDPGGAESFQIRFL